MAGHFFLYTVTGGREVFYAAVDRETERVWTSPTKEGAQRQARDAGLEEFTERVISKEGFLRSMGVKEDPHPPQRTEPNQAYRAQPEKPKGKSWFVGGHGIESEPENVNIPPPLRGAKKSRRAPKDKSPFAAGPIDPKTDDVLIVPSDQHPPTPPFSDQSAVPDDLKE